MGPDGPVLSFRAARRIFLRTPGQKPFKGVLFGPEKPVRCCAPATRVENGHRRPSRTLGNCYVIVTAGAEHPQRQSLFST